jgi:hypothetical protein
VILLFSAEKEKLKKHQKLTMKPIVVEHVEHHFFTRKTFLAPYAGRSLPITNYAPESIVQRSVPQQ